MLSTTTTFQYGRIIQGRSALRMEAVIERGREINIPKFVYFVRLCPFTFVSLVDLQVRYAIYNYGYNVTNT